ncbi:glycosyltransferase [Oleiharenicola lentus]|uniref:Glycosyltransferase n=1 Tax=Oleiharenicola lentus TaxID=2508720 RepID=A0A4Q1C8Q3_9BACT|nr:glycosyltransferase family 4 protein [Oleiharenicola lentus]RXK55288.1 glycosyltransferase [Oleiharenicola lentus]
MIIDTPQWKLAIEVHPADWRFPAGFTWLAGWLWSPEKRVLTDLRAWVDGRCFLANWGLPKPGLDEVYLHRPGPPYLGFTLLLAPHAGASLLRIEVRDQTNTWREIFRTPITVTAEAAGCPPPKSFPDLLPAQLNPLLQLQVRRPGVPLPALADEIVSGAITELHHSLPNPPFFGALEAPREIGWVRFGRLSITGWLAHRERRITRLTAMVDPLQEGTLLYGLPRTDVGGEFTGLAGAEKSAFVGHVDLPADTAVPVLLKLFAELDNGEKHFVFGQRFTPRLLAGAETSLPVRSLRTFASAAWELRKSAQRHGLPVGDWSSVRPAVRTAWTAFATEAPPKPGRARLAPEPAAPRDPSAPLCVLVVTHNLNFEGAPWFIFELARHLAAQPGVTVRVVSPQEGPMRRVFADAGMPVEVVDVAPVMAAKSAGEFTERLATVSAQLPWTETDLVIANTMVTFWAVHAARAVNKPIALYVHESSAIRRFFKQDYDPALFPIIEDGFRLADRVVFTADSSRRVFAHLGSRGNFSLLPSWVDAGRVDAFAAAHRAADLRRKHGLDPEAVLVVNIGSVCERKGQHVFIQAVELLKEELARTYPGRKIQFLMVGARPGLFLETLKEELARLQLGELAHFLPETGEIFDFYHLADIFCCTSFEESFPRVLLESAAFRKLIVSTDVNGIAEMIGPEDAWLIPAGDRYRLADALKQALAAHFAGDRTRPEKARAAVLRKYHEAQSLPRHVRLMRAVAERRT